MLEDYTQMQPSLVSRCAAATCLLHKRVLKVHCGGDGGFCKWGEGQCLGSGSLATMKLYSYRVLDATGRPGAQALCEQVARISSVPLPGPAAS